MARRSSLPNPLQAFLDAQRVVILDGGLASELEARGCDLDDELWSARVLLERPDLIRQVHLDYLRSGADCVISASYQATIDGFARHGLAEGEALEVIRRSVELCQQARAAFWEVPQNRTGRRAPLVAASVGPYGASLADGSEFRGDYALDEDGLVAFHRRRWQLLATSGADLLACETIPSCTEGRALRRLLEASRSVYAWFSFSCRDGAHLSDGSKLAEIAAELSDCPRIAAIGVNCTAPRHIASLVRELYAVTSKPIVVYPNSGEVWDAARRRWLPPDASSPALAEAGPNWVRLGARLVGGCCRTRPSDIELLRRTLLEESSPDG